MLAELLAVSLTLTNASDDARVVGTWRSEPLPGIATVRRLTFTQDGRLIADGDQLLGRYKVTGNVVTARAGLETYVYALADDGRLCVAPGPGLQPAARETGAALSRGQCYRKVAQAT